MRRHVLAAAAVLFVVAAPSAHAQHYDLTFQGLGPDDTSSPTSNAYGDVAGVVDLTYGHRLTFGGLSPFFGNGFAWDFGYNDLVNVLYTNAGPGVGEIHIHSLAAGQSVRFNSADVGSYFNASTTVELRVYNSDFSLLLFSNTGNPSGGTQHASFSTSVTDASDLYVQWSRLDALSAPVDAYNTGIDNVDFDIGEFDADTTTPEPASMVLLATGLIGVAAAGRRFRKAA